MSDSACPFSILSYIFRRIPLALTALELELYVVDGIRRAILAIGLFLGDELFPESVIVWLVADFVHHNFLLIVGDLVDDVFGTAATEFQLVELGDAVRIDGETALERISERPRAQGDLVGD
jgi:hypothetical protein